MSGAVEETARIVIQSGKSWAQGNRGWRIAMIRAALEKTEGNISQASRLLKIHRNNLTRWIDDYGIDPSAYFPS